MVGTVSSLKSSPEALLLVDISQFISWRTGHPTGIQRVLVELLCSLANAAANFAICACTADDDIATVSYERLPPLLQSCFQDVSEAGKIYLRGLTDEPLVNKTDQKIIYLNIDATWLTNLMPALQRVRRRLDFELISLIHDVTPCIQPQWRVGLESAEFTYWLEDVLRMSDRILTISQFSRSEISRYCLRRGIDCPPTDVIRLGDLSERLLRQVDQPGALPRRPIKEDFFLVVGSLHPRKNHRLVYDAWRKLAESGIKDLPAVVVAGGNGHPLMRGFCHEVTRDPEISKYFYFVNGPADWELDWYYKNCLATIYPSIYEGWGLPVAESLCYGKMIFALRVSSLPEINPALTTFIPSNNPDELAKLVLRFLGDDAWRLAQEQLIATNLKPWRWEDATRQLKALLGIVDRTGRDLPVSDQACWRRRSDHS